MQTEETSGTSRAEHLTWCKRRAIEYVEAGDLASAFSSMASDIRKHPDTANHAALELGVLLMMNGHLATKQAMREFIEGFN